MLEISHIYSYCGYSRIVAKMLNELMRLDTVPYIRETGYALALLPTQLWAKRQKAEHTDTWGQGDELKEQAEEMLARQRMIAELNGKPCDIDFRLQKKLTEIADGISEVTVAGIEAIRDYSGNKKGKALSDCLTAVHIGGVEQTRHSLNTYYREAVITLAELVGLQISAALATSAGLSATLDGEEQLVFHDTRLLLEIYAEELRHSKFFDKKRVDELSDREANTEYRTIEIFSTLHNAITTLRSYPCEGEKLYDAIGMYLSPDNSDLTEREKAALLGLSYPTYKGRVDRAVAVLSCILWGYSTRLAAWELFN